MDGLSLAASCIAVIQIAASVSSGLREIKGLRNASNSIFAIVNEVIDLTLVLQDVQSILESNHRSRRLLKALLLQSLFSYIGLTLVYSSLIRRSTISSYFLPDLVEREESAA